MRVYVVSNRETPLVRGKLTLPRGGQLMLDEDTGTAEFFLNLYGGDHGRPPRPPRGLKEAGLRVVRVTEHERITTMTQLARLHAGRYKRGRATAQVSFRFDQDYIDAWIYVEASSVRTAWSLHQDILDARIQPVVDRGRIHPGLDEAFDGVRATLLAAMMARPAREEDDALFGDY